MEMNKLELQLLAQVRTIEDRLLAKRIINENNCWVWTGARMEKEIDNSYGVIGLNLIGITKNYATHRISYALFNNLSIEELDEYVIMHKCDYRPCFNPDHLAAGNKIDNAIDTKLKKRNRNQFSPANDKWTPVI